MATTTLIDNNYVTLTYDDVRNIIHHQFHAPADDALFRNVLMTGVDKMTETGATKWLSDDRGNGPLSEDNTDWTLNEWSPRAIGAGWRAWALVVPDDPAARMNLNEHVSSYIERGLKVRIFTSPIEALTWLDRQ